MLHLASTTDDRWVRRAEAHIDEILLDHAHCEKKAASTALSLIFRYPERPSLMIPLSRLAREELAHFEEVVAILRRRVPATVAERVELFDVAELEACLLAHP